MGMAVSPSWPRIGPCLLQMAVGLFVLSATLVWAQPCPDRPQPLKGIEAEVPDPPELRSVKGKLSVALTARSDGDGTSKRLCLVYKDERGTEREAPLLRVHPKDNLLLHLRNEMVPSSSVSPAVTDHDGHAWGIDHPCSPAPEVKPTTTNLHYHGVNVAPRCHKKGKQDEDEVISTLIQPDRTQFYKFTIPGNDPPGLFWYHPHVHPLSQDQLRGGMTGPLIVEGIEGMHNAVEGLRERVLVLRDMNRNDAPDGVLYIDRPDLLPGGESAGVVDEKGQQVADVLLQGGVANTKDPNDGTFKPTVMPPWNDVSINWIPIVFQPSASGQPAYSSPPVIRMEGDREFWRISNSGADTYFRLQILYNNEPQTLHIVAMDGIPLGTPGGKPALHKEDGKPVRKPDGRPVHKTVAVTEILLPPAGRAEFIVKSPDHGAKAEFVTLFYDTNADYDPRRTLARLEGPSTGPSTKTRTIQRTHHSHDRQRFRESSATHRKMKPDHTLFFHQDDTQFYIEERLPDGSFPNQPFKITEKPRIVVPHGTIQEWKIVNEAEEAHAFHIHQIHFRVMDRSPDTRNVGEKELDELSFRDTVDLPAWDKSKQPNDPPSVTLRMYFNEQDIDGNFVYHCHILEHEDKGMMAIIKVAK